MQNTDRQNKRETTNQGCCSKKTVFKNYA